MGENARNGAARQFFYCTQGKCVPKYHQEKDEVIGGTSRDPRQTIDGEMPYKPDDGYNEHFQHKTFLYGYMGLQIPSPPHLFQSALQKRPGEIGNHGRKWGTGKSHISQ